MLTVAMFGASLSMWGLDFTQGNLKYEVNPDNTSVTVSLVDKNAADHVVIPAQVTNANIKYDVTAIAQQGFANSKIKSVYIPKSIATLGNEAFQYCREIETVTFEEGTAVKAISNHCFKHCDKIKVMEIPEGVESLGQWSLESLESMISLTLPSTLTYMGSGCVAYNYALSVISVNATTPPTLYDKVGSFGFPFRDLPFAAISLYVPDGCTETYAQTPGWNEFSVITTGKFSMFKQGAFTYAAIRPKAVSVVEFDGSTTTPVVPAQVTANGVTYDVVALGGSLFANQKITSVSLPVGLEIIGDKTFRYCDKLKEITLPEGLERIGGGAFNSTDISVFNIPNSVVYIGNDEPFPTATTVLELSHSLKAVPRKCCVWSKLTEINIPEGVTSIGEEAFVVSNSLKKVMLPSTLTSIEKRAFAESPAISNIICGAKVPPEGGSEDIFSMEVYDRATLNVPVGTAQAYRSTMPWSQFNNIEEFEYSPDLDFEFGGILYSTINSSSLKVVGINNNATDVVIPNAVKRNGSFMSVVEIADNAFEGTSIKSIEIAQSVTKIGNSAFAGLNMTSVKVRSMIPPVCPDNAFTANTYNNATLFVGSQCKQNYENAPCWKNFRTIVEEVEVGNVVTVGKYILTILEDQCVALGYVPEALQDKTLKEIRIPEEVEYEGVTYTVTAIAPGGFEKLLCGGREPDGTTHLVGHTGSVRVFLPETIEEIGDRAFCEAHISTINIPSSVHTLGKECFSQCLMENDIVVPGGVTTIPKDAFSWLWHVNKLTLSSGVEEIDESAFIFGKIKEFYLPASISRIGNQAFGYGQQRKVEVEDLEGFLNLTFGDSGANPLCSNADLFWKGNPVTEIDFGDYFITEVGEYALYGCTSLEKVVFPRNLTVIGYQAFNNARNIRTVECQNETCIQTQYTGNAFDPSTTSFGTLYVPVGCKEEYVDNQLNRTWGEFVNVIEKDFGGVDEIEADSNGITVNGNSVINHNGTNVKVYDVTGSLIYSGSDSVINLNRGFYIVAAGETTTKISIN